MIAPDGTVYLGTAQGKLIALHPDGKPFWSRDITPGQSIVASPAVASDGSIYVIGVERIRDNRVKPPKETFTSTLHRFTSTGGWLAQIPFPDHGGAGPAALAPPNIWRSGGVEAIMVASHLPVPTRPQHASDRILARGRILDETTVQELRVWSPWRFRSVDRYRSSGRVVHAAAAVGRPTEDTPGTRCRNLRLRCRRQLLPGGVGPPQGRGRLHVCGQQVQRSLPHTPGRFLHAHATGHPAQRPHLDEPGRDQARQSRRGGGNERRTPHRDRAEGRQSHRRSSNPIWFRRHRRGSPMVASFW